MSRPPSATITGVGATTPVGLSAAASCAALRAGVARLGELETHHVDGEFFDLAPVVGGRVPTEWFSGGPVEWEWPGHERFGKPPPPPPEKLVTPGPERLAEIALPAVREALDAAGVETRTRRIGLFLGLDDEGEAPAIELALAPVVGHLAEAFEAHGTGRAAGFAALEAALAALAADRIEVAVVGGIDSLIRAPALKRLDAAQILRSGTRPQGVIPGEAAAFVVLESRPASRGLARCLTVAVAEEPTAGTDEPNQGVGLTRALRAVREGAGGFDSPPVVLCDLNGDRYRASEWGMAAIRTLGDIEGDIALWHPADRIGDPGAACAVLNLVWAATAFVRGYARAERALVWGASDGAARGAAVLAPRES